MRSRRVEPCAATAAATPSQVRRCSRGHKRRRGANRSSPNRSGFFISSFQVLPQCGAYPCAARAESMPPVSPCAKRAAASRARLQRTHGPHPAFKEPGQPRPSSLSTTRAVPAAPQVVWTAPKAHNGSARARRLDAEPHRGQICLASSSATAPIECPGSTLSVWRRGSGANCSPRWRWLGAATASSRCSSMDTP